MAGAEMSEDGRGFGDDRLFTNALMMGEVRCEYLIPSIHARDKRKVPNKLLKAHRPQYAGVCRFDCHCFLVVREITEQ